MERDCISGLVDVLRTEGIVQGVTELLRRYGIPEPEVRGASETVIVPQGAEWSMHDLG